jgi:hypothetical protein
MAEKKSSRRKREAAPMAEEKLEFDTSEVREERKPKPVPAPVAPPPRANRKPVYRDIKVAPRQYIRARQYRWEQCFGFLYEMKKQFGPNARKTRTEWDVLWDEFWKRPVK